MSLEDNAQINEQPSNPKVNLEGVEIVSNGEVVSTDTPSTETTTDDTTETQEPQQQSTEPPEEQKNLQEAKTEMDNAKKVLSDKGVDYAKLEDEYNTNGDLSKESYEALEKAGYAKEIVKAVLAGWQAKADAFANKIIDTAGGKREYQRIQKFISEQGQDAIDSFNEIVEKSDLKLVNSYLMGIKAQMVAKYGTDNPTLGGNNNSAGVSGYKDTNEMVQAMSDPRYGKDLDYTKEVETRVSKSTFF